MDRDVTQASVLRDWGEEQMGIAKLSGFMSQVFPLVANSELGRDRQT